MNSEDPNPALQAALDSAVVPSARAEFKQRLQAEFLSGEFALPHDEAQALQDALESYEAPAARAEFRAELRERFLSGAQSSSDAQEGSSDTQASEEATPVYSIYRYLTAAVVAAAVVLLWMAPWNSAAQPSWQAVAFDVAQTSPVVSIDGQPVSYADQEQLDRLLSGGCRLETANEPLHLMRLDEGVLLEVAQATKLTVMRSSDEDGVLNLRLQVDAGALRVATRPEFAGTIHVITPDAEISLAGRSLGVDVFDSGTCLCILEGEAQMMAVDGSGEMTVLSNSTAFFFRDGSKSVLMEGEVHHSESLEAAREVSDEFLF